MEPEQNVKLSLAEQERTGRGAGREWGTQSRVWTGTLGDTSEIAKGRGKVQA